MTRIVVELAGETETVGAVGVGSEIWIGVGVAVGVGVCFGACLGVGWAVKLVVDVDVDTMHCEGRIKDFFQASECAASKPKVFCWAFYELACYSQMRFASFIASKCGSSEIILA
jgi:hypothetical protein